MAHWVLTESVNDYDQYGDYYVKSWSHKPTVDELSGQGVVNGLNEVEAKELLEQGVYQEEPYPGLWSSWELFKVK